MLLGDAVKQALSTVGVTEARVTKLLGTCGCDDRRKKLNALHVWARRVVAGKVANAKMYLDQILGV
jgi:hypothetical protein